MQLIISARGVQHAWQYYTGVQAQHGPSADCRRHSGRPWVAVGPPTTLIRFALPAELLPHRHLLAALWTSALAWPTEGRGLIGPAVCIVFSPSSALVCTLLLHDPGCKVLQHCTHQVVSLMYGESQKVFPSRRMYTYKSLQVRIAENKTENHLNFKDLV